MWFEISKNNLASLKEPCTYFLPPVISHNNRNVLNIHCLQASSTSFVEYQRYIILLSLCLTKCSSIAFSMLLHYNPVLPIQAHPTDTTFSIWFISSVNVLPHFPPNPQPPPPLHLLVLATRNAFSFYLLLLECIFSTKNFFLSVLVHMVILLSFNIQLF